MSAPQNNAMAAALGQFAARQLSIASAFERWSALMRAGDMRAALEALAQALADIATSIDNLPRPGDEAHLRRQIQTVGDFTVRSGDKDPGCWEAAAVIIDRALELLERLDQARKVH
jgi:hypothetical protein